MRVLLLNYEYPPYGGGAGVATEALARTLASRGVTVDVVTAGDRSECETELLWDGDAAEEGLLNVHRVRCRRTSVHQASMRDAGSYLRAALPVIRRLLRAAEYDAVHFYFSLPTGALIPFLNLGKTPVIVSLRARTCPATTRTTGTWNGLTRYCVHSRAGSGAGPTGSCRCARVSAGWRCGRCRSSTTR